MEPDYVQLPLPLNFTEEPLETVTDTAESQEGESPVEEETGTTQREHQKQ